MVYYHQQQHHEQLLKPKPTKNKKHPNQYEQFHQRNHSYKYNITHKHNATTPKKVE